VWHLIAARHGGFGTASSAMQRETGTAGLMHVHAMIADNVWLVGTFQLILLKISCWTLLSLTESL